MTLRYVRIVRIAALGLLLMTAGPQKLSAQERAPYTVEELVQLIGSGVFSDARILTVVTESCLGFFINDAVEARLGRVGASHDLIRRLRGVCVRAPRLVTSIRITPQLLEIAVEGQSMLSAQALGPDSVPITDIIFEWSAEDTSVVAVSSDGRVQGKAPGTTRVTARLADGPFAVATVTVMEMVAAADAASGAKSPGTAAALGIVPGGGELYVGNTAKGAAAFVGAAAALAIGYFTTSENTLSSSSTASMPACDAGACTIDIITESEVEETRKIVIGAVVAGAFWAVAFIDGVRTAKRSQAAAQQDAAATRRDRGPSLTLLPLHGIHYRRGGQVDITLVRVGL